MMMCECWHSLKNKIPEFNIKQKNNQNEIIKEI